MQAAFEVVDYALLTVNAQKAMQNATKIYEPGQRWVSSQKRDPKYESELMVTKVKTVLNETVLWIRDTIMLRVSGGRITTMTLR